MKPFTQKYIPKKLNELIGHQKNIPLIKQFVTSYRKEKKKILLLTGPVGCGKTSLVTALANEMGYELLEINTSDARNEAAITTLVGTASKQKSFFFQGKIILLDDIDGLSGTNDRGGVSALVKLAQESAHPIICTALDVSDSKFSTLRSKAVLVTLEAPTTQEITCLLQNVCAAEHILFDEDALRSLARRCGGDIRGVLNDMQTLGRTKITRQEVDALSERDKEEEIRQGLFKIFKNRDLFVARDAFSHVDEEPDTLFLWIDEHLPWEYEQKAERARAYDFLSKADIFRRRIQRHQYWRFLSYILDFLTLGICVAKDGKNQKMITYKQPGRLLSIWIMNQKNAKKKAIAEKIAPLLHVSKKEAANAVVPYLSVMSKKQAWLTALEEEFALDSEEVAWLKK